MVDLGRAPVYIQRARVVGVDTEYRKLTIEWLGQEGKKNNVIPLTDSGNYSLPKMGDTGLVLGASGYNYWLGKIDIAYADKIKGTYKDPETGLYLKYPEIDGGEVQLSNVTRKTKLKLSNTGDIGLLNGFRQGLKVIAQTRWTQLIGETTSLIGNGVRLALGNAIRTGPLGDTPVPGTTGAGKTLEALLEVAFDTGAATIQYAKFHLGELKDLVTGLVPLLSSLGFPLRVSLEANNDLGVNASYLKMDTVGNMEIKAATGLLSLDSGIPAASILLGPFAGTVHPIIFGDLLLTWLTTHTHPTGTGPSGPPVIPPDPTMISTKVMAS